MKRISAMTTLCLCMFLAGCSSVQNAKEKQTSQSESTEKTAESSDNQSNIRNMDQLTRVLFKTTAGDIVIALYDNTPKHRENFIKLVNEKFYNDILFHRIIQGFMIQTGDPDSRNAPAGQMLGAGGPGYTVPAEFNAANYHKRGAVAAARQGDNVNPAKASSGSQFYIVDGKPFDANTLGEISYRYHKTFTDEQKKVYQTVGGAPFLDGDYTVFGEVVQGMNVVDKIAAAPKDRNDRPVTDIKIISAEIVK